MKNFFFTILLLTCSQGLTRAQTDISVSPFSLIIAQPAFSIEQSIARQVGLEGHFRLNDKTTDPFGLNRRYSMVVNASARYYLDPKRGYDRFYLGLLAGGATNGFSLGAGFSLGYKIISEKRIFLDVATGAGRTLTGDGDAWPYGKLNIGYRFQKRDK
ncbi:DUF3575 domain-containing protein [Phaeodactylibacter xiamenensis]|uniref:DUF3575 domain-containing protein n=1 Tax=Phaeodactylibacter xiamenensis TaxID=1524460 RepID=UPI0024A87484|nr:DUF3575 domain-containing protein [Phaeodactylibacter xiamenensis]